MNRDRKARRDALKRRQEEQGAEHRPLTRRGLIALGGQLAVGAVLAYHMRRLQIVEAERYRLLAEENRINLHLIPPVRAEIFDRSGAPLAVNRQNYRVVMIRERAGDVEAMLDRLGLIIDIPPRRRRRVLREMRKKSAFVPVAVADYLDWRDFAAVNANLPALAGVQPEVGLSRHYANGELTAHVVGYVGRVTERELKAQEIADPVLQLPDFQIGKTGIERAIEHELRGTAGTRRIEVNAVGRVIRELDRIDGVPGTDLHLTLDLGLQAYARERLADEAAAVVVIDVNNGDLLALISNPTYDPNLFVRGISTTDWQRLLNNEYRPLANKWASGLYPPGSTFKMMVALAALEAGVVSPEERVFCKGWIKLGRRRFHCWRRGGHGHLKLRQALEQSCDVFYYEMARRAGIERIAAMARRFGLGAAAELPIPAIKGGLIPDKAWKLRVHDDAWRVGDTLNAGIGQGFVLTTPLQLAVMAARLASGREVQPRLIRARGGVPVPLAEPAGLGLRPEHLPVFDCALKPQNGSRYIDWLGHIKMMGTVQPFISGAISKTVNLPEEATVEEIEQTYIEGWKQGLNALAIYRDGSKQAQVLSTKQAAAQPKREGEPTRRRLPATRASITHKFSIEGHEGYITAGLYEDRSPGEIFITMAKEGSTLSGMVDAFATSISLALQYGVPLRDLVKKFSHMRFEPSGRTENGEIPVAQSIVDYIFRWL
ncbi:MAG: penicillin-binding protein 2, partial [Proteobacteria bacterium]|nr:penicillin-binding protein 2 [Pseudomonadota bacterium]